MRREFWIGCALALITFAVFVQVAGFDFVRFDDLDYVVNNGHIESGFTKDSITWAFTTGYCGNWHPLTWISLILDYQVYGAKPGGYHFTNLLLHILNTVLLFRILRAMTGAVWRAAMVAALFALHPLHVESVAWISERKDVLSTFFELLAIAAYVRYAIESKVHAPKSKVFFVLAILCFALALLCKPMVVTLPFLLLLLDFWPLKRVAEPVADPKLANRASAWLGLILEKMPFVVLTIVSSIVTYLTQEAGGAMKVMEHLSLFQRSANALIAYTRYLRKFIWPNDLAFFYPMPASWPLWQILAAAALLVVITIAVLRQCRVRPYLLVGWFWFLGTLVPVIGFVQVGIQSMADRYSYFPLIGIFIMLVWGLVDLSALWPRRQILLGATSGCALAACVMLTSFQLRTWRSSLALFNHALVVTTNSFTAENLLGGTLLDLGDFDGALRHYNAAIKITPDSPIVLCNIGVLYFLRGKPDTAATYFHDALDREPDLDVAHHYLGRIFDQQGKSDEALFHYAEALRSDPENEVAHIYSGILLARRGDSDAALVHLNEAVRLRPHDAAAHYYLGLALVTQGRRDEAIANYRAAVRLQPDWPEALNDLAWLLATNPNAAQRDGAEAVRLAERACELTKRTEARYLGTLDAAYAETGRFAEAIATAEKARALAATSGATNLVTAADQRLSLYRSNLPFHQP